MKLYRSPRILQGIVLALLGCFILIPAGYVLAGSFESPVLVREESLSAFVYNRLSFAQYENTMFHSLSYWIGFLNTMILAVPAVALAVFFASLTAYGLTESRRLWARVIVFLYIVLALLPTQVLLVPNFIALSGLNLIGNRWAVIAVLCFSPYYTYFMYRFCSQLPVETYEAARMEGAGEFCIYRHIALPQMKPVILTLILISGADFWNMLEQPLVFLQDVTKYPLSVFFREMDGTIQYTGAVLFSIPVLMLFLAGGRESVERIGL